MTIVPLLFAYEFLSSVTCGGAFGVFKSEGVSSCDPDAAKARAECGESGCSSTH